MEDLKMGERTREENGKIFCERGISLVWVKFPSFVIGKV